MSKTTLTSSYPGLVSLTSPAYGSPLTVATGVTLQDALYGSGTPWTITNYGEIDSGGNHYGVSLAAGGTITNNGTGTISGAAAVFINGAAGTVVNAGLITASGGGGQYTGIGVYLNAGGYVTNQSGGAIEGRYNGIVASGSLTLSNAGTIYGGPAGDSAGVFAQGGSITNLATGTINGTQGGVNISGTLTNAGHIQGGAYGVELSGSSEVITNQSGAIIIGGTFGVKSSGADTVVNAGTIIGGTDAVSLGSGGKVIVDPGAVFTGTVRVGSSGLTGTLELASGVSQGTLSGLGSKYLGFGHISVDAGAYWVGSSDTIASSSTLIDAGTLVGSVTLASADTLTVTSTGTLIGGGTAVAGASSGTDLVVLAGSISASTDAVLFNAAATNTLTLAPSGRYTGELDGGNKTASSLVLASGASAGTLSGFGSQVTRFGTISVGYGAQWSLTSAGIGSGYKIIDTGTLTNTTSIGSGVTLVSLLGSRFINAAGATVSASGIGVFVTGNGIGSVTIVNAGTMIGTTDAVQLTGAVSSRLIIYPGAVFTGTVNGIASTMELASSASAGTLSSLSSKYINFFDTTIDTGATWVFNSTDTVARTAGVSATLTNSGTVSGAVTLGSGSELVNNATGLVSSSGTGVVGSSGGNTVVNAGGITATTDGVNLQAGGAVTNASGGIITALYGVDFTSSATAGTVVNDGSIGGSAANGIGVFLRGNGTVTNQALGSITGFQALVILGGPGTVANTGTIAGSNGANGYGIDLAVGGAITNVSGGLITGNYAAYLTNGGTVSNQSGATIVGVASGALLNGGGTISNAGMITASGDGAVLVTGGTLINQATGTIKGTDAVVFNTFASGTVINAGSISGSTDAVLLATGQTNRLIVDPGASFTGTVNGANTIGAAATSTLELASSGSTGTLTSLSSHYINFAQLTIDAGAQWTFISSDTVISGTTLTNAGSLTGPVSLTGTALVSNASTGTITSSGTAVIGASSSTPAVVNAGDIIGGSVGGNFTTVSDMAIYLHGGGSITNQSGGTISAYSGIYGYTGVSVINAGSISANTTHGFGVFLVNGGTLTNQSTGTISGYDALLASGVSTITNAGGLAANTTTGRGVMLGSGGTVTNQSGATITGFYGIAANAAVAIVNTGAIAGDLSNGKGIAALGGGVVTNQSGGTITGGRAIYANNATTIVNAGRIGSNTTSGSGIYLNEGGTITNQSGGVVSAGQFAIIVRNAAGTVVNAGSISGGSDAVLFAAGATNRLIVDPGAAFTGTVDGGNVIGGGNTSTLELASAATAGTLSGLGSHYVNFAQTTIDAGASWTLSGTSNTLASGSSFTNLGTLTLSGATLTDNGVITNNGGIVIDPSAMTISSLIGTGTVTIAANSTLDVTGTVGSGEIIDLTTTSGAFYITPGTGGSNFAGVIDGFATGNTIGLNGITDATSATIVGTGTLAITTGSEGTIDLTLNPSQSFTGATFNVAVSGGNEVITANDLPCFVEGTHIDTPDGPVAVEDLRDGDLVCTASGGTRPVHWIGQRHLDPRRHPSPARVQPIRIRADALADGAPRRDVLVSPDHALFIDGMLIAARQLLNRATIVQDSVTSVTYFHVELDAHDVLLADGLPAESYLDTGNRTMFENAGLPVALHPDFAGNDQARRVAASCAPFVDDAALVEPIWQRIADRADLLGHSVPATAPTTDDPELHLISDGRCIHPASVHDNRYVFLLPTTPAELRLVSHHTVPSEAQPWVEDHRSLGVMVREITLTQGSETQVIPMDHPGLNQGWWAVERNGAGPVRWTDGDACLAVPAAGFARLEVVLAGTLPYPLGLDARPATRAA